MPDHLPQLSPEEILELLTQNAEMRCLLEENQWSGLTPIKSGGVCPVCCGSARHGHRPGCALQAILDAPTPGLSLPA
jgi:hypothetical protein